VTELWDILRTGSDIDDTSDEDSSWNMESHFNRRVTAVQKS
jgi:hypothetical protein